MSKKEKLLKKYIDKKKKQITRDELFKQITAISAENLGQSRPLFKTKIRKPKKSKDKIPFEAKLCEKFTQSDTGSEDTVAAEDARASEEIAAIGELDPMYRSILCNEAIQSDQIEHINPPTFNAEGHSKRVVDSLLANEAFVIQKCSKRDAQMKEHRETLMIHYEEADIVSRIKNNLISFIQGSTGCGKTTQIPQFLLENGFMGRGLIGVTQPRRIAAISVSSRINRELNENLCGYQIKYENNITDQTKIKIMTEGVLLREIQNDFLLTKYSVIILDEVHERSVNMDLLVGFLSKITKIRYQQGAPLRLVLMSDTAEVHDFERILGTCQSVRLADKRFKVSIFYEFNTPENYLDAILKKIIGILDSEISQTRKRGCRVDMPLEVINDRNAAILVFLPTKEDIYTLKAQIDLLSRNTVTLPLHSGLEKNKQNLIYGPHDGRKVILATNIAETSLTVEDVVFIIDSGKVKYCLRDSNCIKYQVGFISKSSADQRAGRAGRVAPGVCFRIYSGHTFESFDDKSPPQILLESLDAVMLQLKACGIENILAFPFATPVDENSVRESVQSLQSIDALNKRGNLTALGREMAKYSILPMHARLLCMKNTENIFYYLAVIASILYTNFDLKNAGNSKIFFIDQKSDLIVYLKFYLEYMKEANKRAFCKRYAVSQQTMQEITKHSKHLIRLSGHQDVKDSTEIDEYLADEVCKMIYYAFNSQLGVNAGGCWLYKDGEIFPSRDSIHVGDENIVFGHISCGSTKAYAKNITIVNHGWFV